MLLSQNPVAADQKLRLKSNRKPLQPKNSEANRIGDGLNPKPNPKPKQECDEISPINNSNKENHPIYATPIKIESLDSSLAQELSAIREKLERLRLDGERTERMLRERDMVFEMQMKELEARGEVQKQLEIEVDRLYRLKELKSYCMRISPIRSLRDKQREKKVNESHSQETRADERDESVGENVVQSPDSSSVSSELVTEI